MADSQNPVPSPPSAPPPAEAGLFRRPAVLAGLGAYLLAMGLLAWALSASEPPPLAPRGFPQYEFEDAWVRAALPHLYPGNAPLARVRFRARVDELRWLAELHEQQRSWARAARCYEEIAVLIPSETHPVTRYIRARAKTLARLEE